MHGDHQDSQIRVYLQQPGDDVENGVRIAVRPGIGHVDIQNKDVDRVFFQERLEFRANHQGPGDFDIRIFF